MNKENNNLANNEFVKREKLLIKIINDYYLRKRNIAGDLNKFLREIINSPDNFKTGSLENEQIYLNYYTDQAFNDDDYVDISEENTIYINVNYIHDEDHNIDGEGVYQEDADFQNCAFLGCYLNQTKFINCNFNFDTIINYTHNYETFMKTKEYYYKIEYNDAVISFDVIQNDEKQYKELS
jgi:hypothetical protein